MIIEGLRTSLPKIQSKRDGTIAKGILADCRISASHRELPVLMLLANNEDCCHLLKSNVNSCKVKQTA